MKKNNNIITKIIASLSLVYIIASFYYTYLLSRRYLFTFTAVLIIVALWKLSWSERAKIALMLTAVIAIFTSKTTPYTFLFNKGYTMGLAIFISFLYILILLIVIGGVVDLFKKSGNSKQK